MYLSSKTYGRRCRLLSKPGAISMWKFLILVFVHLSTFAFAQSSFGGKAGLNFNDIKAVDLPSTIDGSSKLHIGFHVGVYAEISLGDRLRFIPEVQYTGRGVDYDATEVKVNYIELPLLLSWSATDWLGVDLGPNPALRVSTILKQSGSKAKVDLYNDLDLGVVAGVRFKINERLLILARYCYGLVPIGEVEFRDANNRTISVVKEYNMNGQVSVGYRLK